MIKRGKPQIKFIIIGCVLLFVRLYLEYSLDLSLRDTVIYFYLIGSLIPLSPLVNAWLIWRNKYILGKGTLIVCSSPYFSSPREWSLDELQSIEVKSSAFLMQLVSAYPKNTIKLQFDQPIARHGQVELYTDDNELYHELKKHAKEDEIEERENAFS